MKHTVPVWLAIMILSVICVGVGTAAAGGAPSLVLPPADARMAPPAPKPIPPAPQARFTEKTGRAAEAVNRREMEAFLEIKLTPGMMARLDKQGFLLIPKADTQFADWVGWNWDEMLNMYDVLGGGLDPYDRKPENARLVTPDVMLHAYHKYIANVLEYIEETHLAPVLHRLLQRMRSQALQYRKASSGSLAVAYDRVAAQLTVPLAFLETAFVGAKDPDPKTMLAPYYKDFSRQRLLGIGEEIALILAADKVSVSPLFGAYDPEGNTRTDYTQYTPRSHYVKTPVLTAYFRAMMYLGRNPYLLASDAGLGDALLITHLLASRDPRKQPLLDGWQQVYAITGFFAGWSDDVGYPEFRKFLVSVLGDGPLDPAASQDSQVLGRLRARLKELAPPRILSSAVSVAGRPDADKEALLEESKSFRVFGQRFTLDAWILGQLTAGEEMTPVRLPSMPSAVFVPAALGSPTAREYSARFLREGPIVFSPDEVKAFMGRMDEVARNVASVPEREWSSSLAAAWLRTLATLNQTYGAGYPGYMQGPLFPVKQLQAFLGSYTELKHDTVLYAKQNMAELGAGEGEGEMPPVPLGLVEPQPEFWGRMLQLVDMTADWFKALKIADLELEEYGRLSRFRDQVRFYAGLADKALAGRPITEEEYERLRTEELGYMSEPILENTMGGAILDDDDKRSGLVTDIHTDAVTRQILYEATGEPYFILALVGNEKTPRLTVGVAFNHYEFPGPLDRRLNDKDWQGLAYGDRGSLPEKPFYYNDLVVK